MANGYNDKGLTNKVEQTKLQGRQLSPCPATQMAYLVALNCVGTIWPAAPSANYAMVGQCILSKLQFSMGSINGVSVRASSNSSTLLAPLVVLVRK